MVSWLRDLVPVTVSIEELADALTMRGFEVSAIDPAPVIPDRQSPKRNEAPDAVLDLEVTTNRPDCLSVLGIAREVATIYGHPLSGPTLADVATGEDPLPVTIEDHAHNLCPRYAASVAQVTVGPSPGWLAARLEAADVRPINNVVDVTNYVLLELGHPMHAFDLEKLRGGELRVRLARPGETVRTLDEALRTLSDDMLVIADAERPQALAGVMGGADSEVTTLTTQVVFESAYFQPVSVRRTSKHLGLSTNASYRFERGADINAPVRAIQRAQALLAEIGAGRSKGSIVDRYPVPRSPIQVTLRHSRISRVLGIDIEPAFVQQIFDQLGFEIEATTTDSHGLTWRVVVPTYRVDVSREIDLIEEVVRHYGYDKLPSSFPAMVRPPAPLAAPIEQRRLVGQVLTASGCTEAITYSFIEEIAGRPFVPDGEDPVRIANPLSENHTVLRPSLIPGLVDSLIYNRRREHRDIRLFEIGRRFTAGGGETTAVAIALTGAASLEHWSGSERETDLFDLTGIIDRVCDALGVTPTFDSDTRPEFVPGQTSTVRAPMLSGQSDAQVTLGHLGQLAPSLASARGLPGAADAVYVAELNLDAIARVAVNRRSMVATPLPRHPSIIRDIALVLDSTLPAARVRGTIRAAAPDTLLHVREFDRFEGKGVPAGSVSLAFRLTFRAPDRTLTDVEVQHAMDAVVAALESTHNATLR